MIALALLLAVADPAPPLADTDPPIIEDVAAAASNPDAAPVITVLLSDRGSGVGAAAVHYRVPGGPWMKIELKGGTSGLFVARLPDGAQRTGFSYWVEATDISGNGPARIGSEDRPIAVDKAQEPTLTRIARQEEEARKDAPEPIDPGWLMLSLGVGVLGAAGAGAYAIDIQNVQTRLDATPAPSPSTREALEAARTQDIVFASVLGVVAVAGLATGVALVAVSSVE